MRAIALSLHGILIAEQISMSVKIAGPIAWSRK